MIDVEIMGGPRDGEIINNMAGAYLAIPVPNLFTWNKDYKRPKILSLPIMMRNDHTYYVVWPKNIN